MNERTRDNSNAPTLAYLYNPTPFAIKARSGGLNIVVKPNTMTMQFDDEYLDSMGKKTGQRIPITNWAANHMAEFSRWGREGLVMVDLKHDPDQLYKKAIAGLTTCQSYWLERMENLNKWLADAQKTSGNINLKLHDRRCEDRASEYYGQPWADVYRHHLDVIAEAFDKLRTGEWLRQVTTDSSTDDDQVRGYQKQITRLSTQLSHATDEVSVLKELLEQQKAEMTTLRRQLMKGPARKVAELAEDQALIAGVGAPAPVLADAEDEDGEET